MIGSLTTLLDAAIGIAALWAIATYLLFPHDLGRALKNGERVIPAQEPSVLVFLGTIAADFGCRALAGTLDLSPEASLPAGALLVAAGCLSASAGLIRGWFWVRRLRLVRRRLDGQPIGFSSYRLAVYHVSGGGSFDDLAGYLPTHEAARQIVEDARGRVVSSIGGRRAATASDYPHVRYVTRQGVDGILRVRVSG